MGELLSKMEPGVERKSKGQPAKRNVSSNDVSLPTLVDLAMDYDVADCGIEFSNRDCGELDGAMSLGNGA